MNTRRLLRGIGVLALVAVMAMTALAGPGLAGDNGRDPPPLTKPEVEAMLRAAKEAAAKAKQARDEAERLASEAEDLAKEGSAFAAAEAARRFLFQI